MVESIATEEPRAGGTRERLLEAAARLFASQGYAGTTTREIAAAVGIQNASIYHHVAGKEELLRDLCVESLNRMIGAATAARATDHPEDVLRAVIAAHVRTALDDRDAHAMMLTELRWLSPDSRQEVIALRDTYESLLAETVASAQAAGVLRDDIASRELTLALLNLLNWTVVWWREEGALSSASFAETLTSLFLDGAAVRPTTPRTETS